ncbi:MAG: Gfo/Idh/MocA family oxidoreductase [Elusimicrobia bacterium]|nr:Gfo/Idh/MocA family oxidoreductase [Elusimicrobiota bacterium]
MKYRGAILGFGQVAEHAHTPAFLKMREHFEIIAVADENRERRNIARRIFHDASFYSSLDELLKGEPALDFIDVSTPPLFHTEQVCRALKRRVNVLCEKPLALNFKDFSKIKALAEKSGLCVFTAHNWKKAPPILKALELVNKGFIGDVFHAELHVLRKQAAIVRKNIILVYGGKGIIEIQDSCVTLETEGAPLKVFDTGEKLSAGSAHPQWMALLLGDFIKELENPAEKGKNFHEAQICSLLTSYGYKSAKSGKPVKITAGEKYEK